MAPVLCGLFVLLGLFVVYKLLDYIIHLPRIGNYSSRYIFITGCDSGFGHELAKHLDSLGCHVFAGCYTEKGETELKKICSERLRPIPVDVTAKNSVRRAYELVSNELHSAGKGLWAVVNNAGTLSSIGQPDWLTVDDYRRQCDVNLFGTIDVTMTFLPLVKKTKGRIVNMSSNLGRLSYPIYAPYSVSKFGVEAFTDALRRCLNPFGCRTVLIEPAGFGTVLMGTENVQAACDRTWSQCPESAREDYSTEYVDRFKRQQMQGCSNWSSDLTPVTDAYEHALLACRPRPRYLVGYDAVFVAFLASLPEFVTDWWLARRTHVE